MGNSVLKPCFKEQRSRANTNVSFYMPPPRATTLRVQASKACVSSQIDREDLGKLVSNLVSVLDTDTTALETSTVTDEFSQKVNKINYVKHINFR